MSNLRPCHVFEIEGSHYVYSVWGMTSRRVSARAAAELAVGDGAAALSPETEAVVDDLGLRWSEKVRGVEDMAERDRRAVARVRETPEAVTVAALFVTQDCNMRCPYCYGDGGGFGGGGAMSPETAFRAVDWLFEQAGDAVSVLVSFFGGEPLLNVGLIERVVAYARGKAGSGRDVTFSLTSNLSLLDDRTLAFLVANKVNVLVSFDGPRHIQNRNRPLRSGEDSYDAVVPRIHRLLAALPDTNGRATLAEGDDPWEVALELLALGFRRVYLQPPSGCLITGSVARWGRSGEGSGPGQALADLYRTAASRFRQAVARRDAQEARQLSRLANVGTYFPTFLGGGVAQSLSRRRLYFFCGRANTMVAVAANGDIYPCHRFVGTEAFRMGNVHTGEFHRGDCLRSPLVEGPECGACWARYLCGGSCQHDSAAATGDPMRPDPRSCADRCARIECAIHAVDGLGAEESQWLAEQGIMTDARCRIDF